MSMSWRLVDDLIHDILLRLSAKDLLRFRCLSKSICTTIDSPDFAIAHLNLSRRTKTRRKLVSFVSSTDNIVPEFYASDFDGDDDNDDEIYIFTKLNNPLEPNRSYTTTILCSCNGLLLLRNTYNTVVLWNPFTKRSKRIPCDEYSKYPGSSIGLGYDVATNDYKVVTIRRVVTNYGTIKARVFEVASNKVFEVASDEVVEAQRPFYIFNRVGVFANGFIHWILWIDKHEYSIRIGDGGGCIVFMSFDISKQVFVKVLPSIQPARSPIDECDISLQILEEGRAILGLRVDKSLELFEAVDGDGDGDGEGFTWKKLYQLNIFDYAARKFCMSEGVKVLELSKEGKKILLQYPAAKGTLYWYSLQPVGSYNYKPADQQILHNLTRPAHTNCYLLFLLHRFILELRGCRSVGPNGSCSQKFQGIVN